MPTPLGDITSLYRSTTGPRDTLGRRYKPTSFPNRAARHPRATLQPQNVPQQFCATPSGNTLPLFRRWRVRIEAVLNKPGDSFSTLGRRFKPTSFHNRAMRHSRATLQPLNVPQQGCAAPLGNTLPLFRRRNIRIDPVMNKPGDTFGTAYTLGRRYKPISSHNRAARHSRATLQPQNVPQQFCAAPSGNALPLFRRWRVRIEAVFNKPGDSFSTLGRPLNYIVPQQGRAALSGDITAPKRSPSVLRGTLGQHYRPISFHNRAARHSLATLQPLNVPHQFCAAPSGNTLPLFRRRNVRIDPVMNMLGDTFGTPWATIQAHIATPIEPHCTFGRHYYVPERVVVDDGAAGCNCSHKKANNTCN